MGNATDWQRWRINGEALVICMIPYSRPRATEFKIFYVTRPSSAEFMRDAAEYADPHAGISRCPSR